MPAYLQADPAQGPGHGIIIVSGLSVHVAPLFALYRASDGLCLSPSGWQSTEVYTNAPAWDCDAGALRLAVNASVVDHMDALDTYRLLIKEGNDKPTSHTLLVKDIVYSSMHGGQGIVAGQRDPVIAPPQPEPQPEPEPVPPPVETAPLVDMPDLEMATTPQGEKSKTPLLIGLLILLLAAGGGVWWYMQKDKQPAAQVPAAPPTAPAAPASAPAPQLSPLQQAREHLRAGSDGTKGLELAQNLLKAPVDAKDTAKTAENADAAFLLVEDAAQKNVPAAMLRLAAFYDPTDVTAKGSITADAAQAYAWYGKARDAGQAEAQSRLGLLRAWAESQAAKGDAAAKALLAQWK